MIYNIYTVLHELQEFKAHSQPITLHCTITLTFSSQKTVLCNPMAGSPAQFSEEKYFLSGNTSDLCRSFGLEWTRVGQENMLKMEDCFSIFASFYMYSRHFWRKSLRTLEPGFYLISSFWPSLPSGVDAAYEATSKDIVFIFKGNCYAIIF